MLIVKEFPRIISVLTIVSCSLNMDMLLCRGTDMASPHGIPVDLLDRLVIIRTQTYDLEEMIKVYINFICLLTIKFLFLCPIIFSSTKLVTFLCIKLLIILLVDA